MDEFLRRNPGFSFRTPEAVSLASSRVSEEDIRGWFRMVDKWLSEKQMREILEDPTRVFNADETSFYLHPVSKEVIARTGSRNVYEVQQAVAKQNVTVMFAFGASGVVVTPHVILPGKRIRKEVAQGFPADWGLGLSDRGWMDSPNMGEFIVRILHPYLVKHGIKLPVILFVDGHSSHNALEVADLCLSKGIVLIALYPNTTHITQPADVAVFKPLKSEWKRSVDEWRNEHQGCALTMPHFGRVLEKAVERGIKPTTIQNGFRICGLHPFDPDAVDYSKCVAKAKTTALVEAPETIDSAEPSVPPVGPQESFQETLEQTSRQADGPGVTISYDRIIEAYDIIGPSTIAKIEGAANLLSREERIIRFFYRQFVRPHINFTDMPPSMETCTPSNDQLHLDTISNADPVADSTSVQIDINNCEIVEVDDISAYCEKLDLTHAESLIDSLEHANAINSCADSNEDNEPNEPETKHLIEQDLLDCGATPNNIEGESFHESPISDHEGLQDITNKPQMAKVRRLSDVLRLPPTPCRSVKHRNYARQYHPVLTAGERLEELRKKEQQKVEMEQQKKRKALERQDAKQKREEAKKAKLEERERKKKERKPKKIRVKAEKKRVAMRD
nr:stress response protein NST1-like [Aedes albopictus]